ncbi:uncharacterized protein [Drosophila bipectinata]|uniref:uncharacterized protein n=1 Tax=Drosophila bipectinata TaxID=42026 RepID=UPI001C8A1E05|nr:uncharacterized protein LOC122321689 [Drosophila bipectinata]
MSEKQNPKDEKPKNSSEEEDNKGDNKGESNRGVSIVENDDPDLKPKEVPEGSTKKQFKIEDTERKSETQTRPSPVPKKKDSVSKQQFKIEDTERKSDTQTRPSPVPKKKDSVSKQQFKNEDTERKSEIQRPSRPSAVSKKKDSDSKASGSFVFTKKPLPSALSDDLLQGERVSDRRSERRSERTSDRKSISIKKKSLEDRKEPKDDKDTKVQRYSEETTSILKEQKSSKSGLDDERPSTNRKQTFEGVESGDSDDDEESRKRSDFGKSVTISTIISKKTIDQDQEVGRRRGTVDTFGSDDDDDVEGNEYLESMLDYQSLTDTQEDETESHVRDGSRYTSRGTQSGIYPIEKTTTSGPDDEWSISTAATASGYHVDDEGMGEDDSLYGSSTTNSTWGTNQSGDERSVILAEIIDIGKLKELKQDEQSTHDFMRNRRSDKPIDEIRGAKITGTATSHIEEVGYPSSFDEDEDVKKEKKKCYILGKRKSQTEISEASRNYYKKAKMDSKPTGLNRWRFPIEDNLYDISGEPQELRRKDKVRIGKVTKRYRYMGVNTDVSRKPRPKVEVHAENAEPVSEPEPVTFTVGRSNAKPRDVGVNTTIPAQVLQSNISHPRLHVHAKMRDIGTNTPKYYEAIDDGTPVKFSDPIHPDLGHLNELIVKKMKPPKNPIDLDIKSRSRLYYEDCEHHFPQRNWRRYYYKKDEQGRHIFRRPSRWLYTILFTIGYLLFVLLFAMAWFDHITTNTSLLQPMLRMSQPSLSLAPSGPKSSPYSIAFDPRNNTEVMEKCSKVLTMMERYGDSGHNPRFGPCVASEKFGYESGEPCVFIKINRIIGFKTDPFTHADNVVRGKMDMKDYMALRRLLNSIPSDADRENRTWINCRTNPQKIVKVEYYPEPAFQMKYTDIESKVEHMIDNRTSFFSPADVNRIVAVRIKNLKPNERVHLKCQIYARNINQDGQGLGHVSFYVVLATKKSREKMQKVLKTHDSL